MLGPEGEHDGVVVGRRLELEVEGGAELLAQGQAEALVDPAAERGVDDHLHPAGLVEEPLEHDVVAGGQDAELAQGGGQVVDQLAGVVGSSPQAPSTGAAAAPSATLIVGRRRRRRRRPGEDVAHGPAQGRDLLGELVGPARGLARPRRGWSGGRLRRR